MIREVISYYDKTQKHWNVEKYVCIKMKCCNFLIKTIHSHLSVENIDAFRYQSKCSDNI